MPLAGEIIKALDPPVEDEDFTDITTITSTAFIVGSPEVSVTFTAPPSGKVLVTVYAQIEAASTATGTCSFEIRETNGSGTQVVAPSLDVAAVNQETTFSGSERRKLITGLTAGGTYFARTMHRTSNAANAASVFSRGLLVEMVP